MILSERFDTAAFAARHGGHKESRSPRAAEWLFPCPCGSERLRYNARKGTWICWICGRTGTQVGLVRLLENCDDERAVEIIGSNTIPGGAVLGPLNLSLRKHPGRKGSQIRVLPEVTWPRGVEVLDRPCAAHAPAWGYLMGRGLDEQTIRSERIGFGRTGWLRDYVVFPVHMDRAFVYWQARSIHDPPPGVDRKAWAEARGWIKNLNLPSDGVHAESHEVVYGYDRVCNAECVVITEGPFDRLKTGPEHTVALLGKHADPIKVERLRRLPCRQYVIYLDSDVAPELIETLARELHQAGEVWIASPPPGWDPGDFSRFENAEILRAARPWTPGELRVEISA